MRLTRRQFVAGAFLSGTASLVGCQGNGNVSLMGYTTEPPFDPSIRSVSIPIFKNPVFHTAPYRGIEVDITEGDRPRDQCSAHADARRTRLRESGHRVDRHGL